MNMSIFSKHQYITTGRPQYLLLMDAYVLGEYEFLKEYAPKLTDKYTDDGVSMRAVATSEGQKMRGMWDPNYTTIHFAPDKDSLMKLFYSGMFFFLFPKQKYFQNRSPSGIGREKRWKYEIQKI